MKIKAVIDEDFNNYLKPAMFIGFPSCTFKCEREYGEQVCQNSILAQSPTYDIEVQTILDRYQNNNLTSSIVIGGLEPFDDFCQLYKFVVRFRECSDDDVVIYSGYYEHEVSEQVKYLSQYKNIIVKFGRYIPNHVKHFDSILGIDLASDNQYAKRIS